MLRHILAEDFEFMIYFEEDLEISSPDCPVRAKVKKYKLYRFMYIGLANSSNRICSLSALMMRTRARIVRFLQ
jgi:hypothetical protein